MLSILQTFSQTTREIGKREGSYPQIFSALNPHRSAKIEAVRTLIFCICVNLCSSVAKTVFIGGHKRWTAICDQLELAQTRTIVKLTEALIILHMSLRISAKRTLLGVALGLAGLALAEVSSLAEVEQHEHPVPEKLGRVTFATSCTPAVQQQFERAVALLHSFAYSAAEQAFRDVIKADPRCAMAHWGVAMTYFHQLWEPYLAEADVARGRSELEQAKGMSVSGRERGFIDALNIIYTKADSVPYHDRANEYTQAMQKLAEANPGDVECQVFYALALVGMGMGSPTDATHEKEKKAVSVLEPLFEKYPEHPGIPHYLIHACDNAAMATRGVAAARVYSQIAPSAPHALHMPSHIYTRLGMWDQSIASNLAARKAAHAQGDTGEELHAMDYLTYAYLQLGRESEAGTVVEDLSAMPALHAERIQDRICGERNARSLRR